MAFLDRFKPQPRWRHADPVIRAGAIAEVPDDIEHRAVLLELATEDPDLRVRRAAAARLSFAEDLVRVVRVENDDDLKRTVADRLVALASSPSDDDGEAALALEGLDDPRHLSTIAKQSPHDSVRAAALGRVHDVRALGSVARHAADPQTALEAVTRIADRAELLNVALKAEHKDAALAALERAVAAEPDGDLRPTLEMIAGRAKNKAVARQARALAQAFDQAEAARRAALEAWQLRVADVLSRLEACATQAGGPDTAGRLAEAEADWRSLSSEPAYSIDADTMARHEGLAESARSNIARYDEEMAAQRAAEEKRLSVLAAATSLCNRVEEIRGDMAEEQIVEARAEWDGLAGDSSDSELAALRVRFLEGCDRATERFRNRKELERVHARLAELSQEAESLAQTDPPADAWNVLVKEWEALSPGAEDLDPAVSGRYGAAVERVRQRQEERQAAAERTLRQQVQRIEQLIDRAHKRAAVEDLTLREADRLMRDLRSSFDSIPPGITDERERHALAERLRQAQSALNPRLHDLREMDEWKRFANAAVQEELIAKTEALRVKFGFDQNGSGPKDGDLEKLARELHDIQERWRTVAEAPRAQAQTLWHRYRQAADPMQTRVREFFVQRNDERRQNLDRKVLLIERAEAVADSTDWIKTADELKKLQAEWQQIGPVPRQESKATWKRFREACDRFFTRRNADLAERKEVWSANLARKEALCKRAEELAVSTEWDKAAAEIRRLQAEWKNVGPVRRNKSDAIWQRFRAASDLFFERFKHRDEIDLQSKQAHREELLSELESLAASSTDGSGAPPAGVHGGAEGLLERVRSLRSRWNLTTPVVRQGADPLSGRFMTALENVMAAHPAAFVGTELDADANRQKMERLCARVEALSVENVAPQPANSSQALAEMLREALAANTIGGRASEESKWRQMAEEVRQAQASWSRLGPVPGETGRVLTERFHRACNRFQDQYRRKMPAKQARGKAVGTR
jgi:hypothetical protein